MAPRRSRVPDYLQHPIDKLWADAQRRDPDDAPDLAQFRANARRRDKLSTPVAALVTLTVVVPFAVPGAGFLVFGAPFLAVAGLLWHLLRRQPSAEAHALTLCGEHLVAHDASGAEISRIHLQEPFTYEYRSKGWGSAVYQLRQGSEHLDFSSSLPLARYVVRDLLCLEWPPQDHSLTGI